MRTLTAVCLLAMLCITPLAQAQSSGFPLCSETELAYVLALQSDYDALVDSLSAGEISLDAALTYSAAQIQWREGLWSGLPPCAEAIDVAVLMSHISNDLGALAAMNYAGVLLSMNRYKDRLHFDGNLRERLQCAVAERRSKTLIENKKRAQTSQRLPSVNWQLATMRMSGALTVALLDSQDLIVAGSNTRSRGELLDYVDAKLAWRDDLWYQLPPCAESLEIGPLMSEAANDLATAIAYSHAGVSPAENPFAGTLAR